MNDAHWPSGGERPHRRHDWAEGPPLTLADGATWYGPTVDLALLITERRLLAALRDMAEAAARVLGEPPDSRARLLPEALYHASLAIVAVRLLQVNYDLPDTAWAELGRFESPGEMMDLAARLREVLGRHGQLVGSLAQPTCLGPPVDASAN